MYIKTNIVRKFPSIAALVNPTNIESFEFACVAVAVIHEGILCEKSVVLDEVTLSFAIIHEILGRTLGRRSAVGARPVRNLMRVYDMAAWVGIHMVCSEARSRHSYCRHDRYICYTCIYLRLRIHMCKYVGY